MTPKVIARIMAANPSCVMLKHEDCPGLDKITALRRMQKLGDLRPFSILAGNGGLFLPQEMERGADGAMTGYAYPGDADSVPSRPRAPARRGEAHRPFRPASAARSLALTAAGARGLRCANMC